MPEAGMRNIQYYAGTEYEDKRSFEQQALAAEFFGGRFGFKSSCCLASPDRSGRESCRWDLKVLAWWGLRGYYSYKWTLLSIV